MNKLTRKAFTLIELLIVIGIISLLAVTVLLALNPAEAQKKGRDTNRIKAATTIQAALEQYLDSGSTIPTTAAIVAGTAAAPATSGTTAGTSQNCTSGNWMGIDVCQYIKTVPLDPSNGASRTVVAPASAADTTTTTTATTVYRARIAGSSYEIDVRQESTSNSSKTFGDGGDATQWFEVFSGVNTIITGN